MQSIYDFFIQLFIMSMRFGSMFNEKIRKGWEGRQQSLKIVGNKFSADDKVIWMHTASLGEYEQGLPVLENLKKEFPNHKILLTFFSPSGYDVVIKKNNLVDAICYLPFDSKKEISNFTSQFATEIFITVKYEYWYNLFHQLKQRGSKIYVISSLFYDKQVFFKSYGKWFVKQLKQNVDWFFHQTESSFERAKSIGLSRASVVGDTRFDRVKQIKNRDNFVDGISEFKENYKLLVVGSSWDAEEVIAKELYLKNTNLKIIIAPHDINRTDLIKRKFKNSIVYSDFVETKLDAQVLIIDSIGLLSKIYSYADIALVGGGFHSAGLHNILEPATFGIPVFFGANYKKNPEADELIIKGGAKSFKDEKLAIECIQKVFENEDVMIDMGKSAEMLIDNQPNSTLLIMKKIKEDQLKNVFFT